MMDFYVTGQSIRFASPVIAANSLDFLQARFHFSGDTWDGYSKWAHFRQGETVFDLNLIDDQITREMHLNLSLGSWEVYLTGTPDRSRTAGQQGQPCPGKSQRHSGDYRERRAGRQGLSDIGLFLRPGRAG